MWDVKEPTHCLRKTRGRSSPCGGLSQIHTHILIPSLLVNCYIKQQWQIQKKPPSLPPLFLDQTDDKTRRAETNQCCKLSLKNP